MAGGQVISTITVSDLESNGASALTSSYQITGNEKANFDQLVPVGTNTEYTYEFTHSNLQSVTMYSQNGCTLKFNSSGSPVPQIVLEAGQILHWDIEAYAANSTLFPNPFTADVTAVYVTATVAGTVQINTVLAV
jgi:hypothetical protein